MITMKKAGLILFMLYCAVASAADNAITPAQQRVVLISLDGFRHDYIEKHHATALGKIARAGVRAEGLIPVFPANTFPNHLSIITGLYPEHHGIVNNGFADKGRLTDDGFSQYNMGDGRKDSSWLKGIPLWNLAEFHGRKAATYFWPESDARINGALPSYFLPYSKYSDYDQRIDQIIAWLSLPDAARPQFIAGYFSAVDSNGHHFGPDSEEAYHAVQKVDALMGRLYQRLQALDEPVNLVIVSDHGMVATPEDNIVTTESLSIPDWVQVKNEGSQLMLYARPEALAGDVQQLEQALAEKGQDRFDVLSMAQRKAMHVSSSQRSGDILLNARPPFRFIGLGYDYISAGSHGYLPSNKDMQGIFIAAGPAFKQGKVLPAMSNLEIYPGLAKVMGLSLLNPVDAKPDTFVQALKTD